MRKWQESAFSPGDIVEVIQDYAIDYSDCAPDPTGVYAIPQGSSGFVTWESNDFGCELRAPVRFYDVENYPMLVHTEKRIGPGHYIPERMLRLVEKEDARRIQPVDLDGFF